MLARSAAPAGYRRAPLPFQPQLEPGWSPQQAPSSDQCAMPQQRFEANEQAGVAASSAAGMPQQSPDDDWLGGAPCQKASEQAGGRCPRDAFTTSGWQQQRGPPEAILLLVHPLLPDDCFHGTELAGMELTGMDHLDGLDLFADDDDFDLSFLDSLPG